MQIISLPKKTGGTRTIYIPDDELMTSLRQLSGRLTSKAQKACPENVHGFMRDRSPVTNASAHIGHQYTLCFDLQDFFESVTPDKLKGKLSKDEIAVVFVDGSARQGLPTSPAVANLAFSATDHAILKWLTKANKNVVYTRYADDLSFSFDDPALSTFLMRSR